MSVETFDLVAHLKQMAEEVHRDVSHVVSSPRVEKSQSRYGIAYQRKDFLGPVGLDRLDTVKDSMENEQQCRKVHKEEELGNEAREDATIA